MNPQRLLTFLGSGDYQPCRYTAEDFHFDTSFASIAAAEWIASRTGSRELVKTSVFCTQTVRSGIPTLLSEWKLPTEPEFPDIPESGTENDYWVIFQTICDSVRDGETVWLDITHSFRYLPLLGYAVVGHLQAVRRIEVGAILYGAAETLGRPKDWPEDISSRRVPIRDLTPFLTINRWTAALRAFNDHGSGSLIRELANQRALPLAKASRGRDRSAAALQGLGRELESWALAVTLCRGSLLIDSNIGPRLQEFIAAIGSEIAPALAPEFDRLQSEFADVRPGQTKNLLTAAEWCLEKNLLQQSLTLLFEWAISFFHASWSESLQKVLPGDPKMQRTLVSQILNVSANNTPPSDWEKPMSQFPELGANLSESLDTETVQWFRSLGATRNDINHAGLNDNAAKSATLQRNLPQLLGVARNLIQIHPSQE